MRDVLLQLDSPSYLYSYSALDTFLLKTKPSVIFVATTATLIELAKFIPGLTYPGTEDADAAALVMGNTILFKTVDSLDDIPRQRLEPLNLLFDLQRNRYLDRFDIYPALRAPVLELPEEAGLVWEEIGGIGILLSRYHYGLQDRAAVFDENRSPLSVEQQRTILSMILTGRQSQRGLEFLMDSGFIRVHWPVLQKLNSVDHSKEYHPEGNVWEHTMAALSQRKYHDLPLGLGLLLHDIGKLEAEKIEGNQFHNHAQIGAYTAADFLRNLEIPEHVIEEARYLVQYHMLPAAVAKIPLYKIEKVVASPYFPQLLELFRCDLASSFRDLEKYYNACKWYRKYRKNAKNPYRKNDGTMGKPRRAYHHPSLSKSVQ